MTMKPWILTNAAYAGGDSPFTYRILSGARVIAGGAVPRARPGAPGFVLFLGLAAGDNIIAAAEVGACGAEGACGACGASSPTTTTASAEDDDEQQLEAEITCRWHDGLWVHLSRRAPRLRTVAMLFFRPSPEHRSARVAAGASSSTRHALAVEVYWHGPLPAAGASS